MSIDVDGVIYIQVVDAIKASYNIEDYVVAIANLGQTTLRSEIGKLTMDETFMYRDEINSKVVAAIEPEAEVWGVKLLRYEVKDIDPPDRIRNTMIK